MIEPRRLPDAGNYAEQWNRMARFLRSLRPAQVSGANTRWTQHGTLYRPGMQSRPATARGSSSMQFRGEYLSTVAYAIGDVVVIRTGTNAGAYICVTANPGGTNPPTQPDTGNAYWISLGIGNAVGQWM